MPIHVDRTYSLLLEHPSSSGPGEGYATPDIRDDAKHRRVRLVHKSGRLHEQLLRVLYAVNLGLTAERRHGKRLPAASLGHALDGEASTAKPVRTEQLQSVLFGSHQQESRLIAAQVEPKFGDARFDPRDAGAPSWDFVLWSAQSPDLG